MPEAGAPALSFVIPLRDECATLRPLFDRISSTVESRRLGSFEVIFVDDGSSDGSWDTIASLHREHGCRVVGLRHRRNFGKATALATGFASARAPIIFTLDADLQDDPVAIPAFLEKLAEGYDLVSGWKQRRQDPPSKTVPSRLFNWVTRAISGIRLHDFNCGYKAYRREVAGSLRLYGELHRYIPILAHAEGYRLAEIPVPHHPRVYGRSHYGSARLAKGFLDLLTVVAITRYLRRPGHFFGGLGLLSGLGGFAILGWLTVAKVFLGQPIGQRPLFFLGILLMVVATQLLTTGLLGEMLIKHGGGTTAPDPVSARLG